MRPDHDVGVEQVAHDARPPIDRPERLDHRHQPGAARSVDGARAGAPGCATVRGVVEVDAEEHLAAVEAAFRAIAARVVAGEPVVELERRRPAGRPGSSSRTRPCPRARRAAAGPRGCRRWRARRRPRAGRARPPAGRAGRCGWPWPAGRSPTPQGAAGRVVGGDDHQAAVRRAASGRSGARGPQLRRPRSGARARVSVRRCGVDAVRGHGRSPSPPPASAVSTSAVGRHRGRALEPRRRRWRRRRWRTRMVRSSAQPASRPWQSAPPNASPAPRPLTTSTGIGGTSTRSSRVVASTPRGPCLTTASSTPRSSSASAARVRVASRRRRSRTRRGCRPRR